MNIGMKKNLIALSMIATLAACGSDDDYSPESPSTVTENTAATFSGDLTGDVTTEDGSTTTSGTADASDIDSGEGIFTTTATAAYGTFTIESSGAWTYALDVSNSTVMALDATTPTLEDTISVTSFDGTMSSIVVTITWVNPSAQDPATFAGDTTESIAYDAASVMGTVNVTDIQAGEDSIVAQVSEATTYGTFSIDADGDWTYTLTTSHTDVSGLAVGATLTDTIDIASFDGTASTVVITIDGPIASDANQVAQVSDTIDNDAGELRYDFGSSSMVDTGKLTLRFKKEAGSTSTNPGDAGEDPKDAYIALMGTSGSTSPQLFDLKVGDAGDFRIRGLSGDITLDQTYTPGAWVEVEITWDASAADASTAPTLTLSIDGTPATSTDGTSVVAGAFSSQSSDLSSVVDGVRRVSLRLGDTDAQVPTVFIVDDLKVYSDVAGTTVIFEDDFESQTLGHDLDDDGTYNSSSSEAIVVEVAQ